MKREIITSFDQKQISVAIWDEVESPKGIVQILHGLAEHIARYYEFATFLNKNGYIVVGDDHRGHGETDRDSLGLDGGCDTFESTVNDELLITDIYRERYGLPVVVLGHSYGSFLLRRYMVRQAKDFVKGYILSGSSQVKGISLSFARLICARKLKKRRDNPAKIIAKMTFKKYDRKTKEGKNDWLSRDSVLVGAYNLDPLCGFLVSFGFYRHFFAGINRVNKHSSYKKIPKDKKILVASGDSDIFGGCGRLVERVHESYLSHGLSSSLILYKDSRHEILNELTKELVYQDFLSFINQTVMSN